MFALCGVAIAQPLFDLLGRNSTFLVVHDIGGVELVALAVALVVLPPLAILTVLFLVRLLSARVAWVVFCGIAGALVALIVAPAVDRSLGMADWLWFATMIAVAIGAALLFARARWLRGFATYLSAAPVLFLVLFLFISPANALLSDTDPVAVAGASTATTPVVMVVFDEFPLGALVDGNGRLDTARFPGFARLARTSTWYPNATTVSTATDSAVPAILSGRLPDPEAAPVAAVFPRSLFTLLGEAGPVRAIEDVTHICPDSICADDRSPRPKALLSDLAVVLGHNLLPDGLETRWLPSLDGQWSDFGTSADAVEPSASPPPSLERYKQAFWRELKARGGRADPVGLFNDFVKSVHGPARSGLWYGHFHFPHAGYTRLHDGTEYMNRLVRPERRTDWPLTEHLSGFQALRFMLQAAYADRLLDDLLDRLERERMLDRALLVVVSDHGQSFRVPDDVRGANGLTEVNRDEVLPVPLFIKYPHQSRAGIDRRIAETTDILPTVADALEVRLPSEWTFDGTSLLAPASSSRRRTLLFIDATPEMLRGVRAARMGGWIRRQIVTQSNDQNDLYRLAPYGALVGQPVAGLGLIPPLQGATAMLDAAGAYGDIDPASGQLPAMVRATLSGVDDGDGHVAVALNGTIAGLGPTFRYDDRIEAAAILDPRYFRSGANTVALYRVSGDPAAPDLQLIASRS